MQTDKGWIKVARIIGEHFSPCLKRKFGAVIVADDERLLTYGYNESYRGDVCDPCLRVGVKSGTQVELCRAIHAEQMALINALNNQIDIADAILYVAGVNGDGTPFKSNGKFYCTVCARLLNHTNLAGVVTDTIEGPKFRNTAAIVQEAYSYLEG